MLRPEVPTRQLLQQEFQCRESAGYDLTDSGWHPSSSRAALRHARAGIRSPAETERVWLPAPDVIPPGGCHMAGPGPRRGGRVAAPLPRHCHARDRHSGDEAAAILTWCEASGVRADDLIVMTPDDGHPYWPM